MKLQKARKNHICDDCERKILKGEKYWRDIDEDSKVTLSKTHTNCELFRDKEHDQIDKQQ